MKRNLSARASIHNNEIRDDPRCATSVTDVWPTIAPVGCHVTPAMMGGPTVPAVEGRGTAIDGYGLTVVDGAAGDDNTGVGAVVAGSCLELVVAGTPGALEGTEQLETATAQSKLAPQARLWIRRLVTVAP